VNSTALRLVKRALDEGGIEMPNETYTVSLQRMGYGRQTKAAEREVTEPSIEEEARGADVSVDRQVEEQIKGDLASSDEENLLPDEARKPS
jgi:hypothetical protein